MVKHSLHAFYHVWFPLHSSPAKNYRWPISSTLQRSIRRPTVRQTAQDTWTHPPTRSAYYEHIIEFKYVKKSTHNDEFIHVLT